MIAWKGSFLADLMHEIRTVGMRWGVVFLILVFGLPLALFGLQFAAELPVDVHTANALPKVALSVVAGLAVAAVLWCVRGHLWGRDIVYLLVAFHLLAGQPNALSVGFGAFVLFYFCADVLMGLRTDGATPPVHDIQARFHAFFARLAGNRT